MEKEKIVYRVFTGFPGIVQDDDEYDDAGHKERDALPVRRQHDPDGGDDGIVQLPADTKSTPLPVPIVGERVHLASS